MHVDETALGGIRRCARSGQLSGDRGRIGSAAGGIIVNGNNDGNLSTSAGMAERAGGSRCYDGPTVPRYTLKARVRGLVTSTLAARSGRTNDAVT